MTRSASVVARLTGLPVLAAVVVITLSAVTVLDLMSIHEEGTKAAADSNGREGDPAILRVPLEEGVPEVSRAQAVAALKTSPTRVAVDTLWPLCDEREKLRSLLLSEGGDPFVRLHLLGLFERESSGEALTAAREIVGEEGLAESELLLAAFEILAEHGEKRDLDLFRERPGETPQLKALRIGYRGILERRISGDS